MNLVSSVNARAASAFAPVRLAVILSLLVHGIAVAGETPLTLDEAIALSVQEAPQIAAAQASLEGAEALAPSANRLPDPEAIVGIDNLPINTVDRYSLTNDFMTMRKLGVMQTVPNGAKRRLRGERGAREIDLAQAQLLASRFDASRAAAEAWIACATSDQALKRLTGLRSDLGLQSDAARASLASGRGTAGDALASETLVARLDDRILALEQQFAMQRAELSRWIGANAARDFAELPVDRELGAAPQALIDNVAEHPPLAPLAAGLELARAEVALAKAERRPDWSAEFSYAKRGPDFSDMVSLEFRIGLPLFGGHRQNPVIAAKLANVRAKEASQQAEVRMHRAEIEGTLAQWQSGRLRLKQFDSRLLPLAHDRANAVLASYRSGQGELRPMIEALQDEIDLQLEYVELEGAVARAWVFLHLLHGGAQS
jgi:cobalt-zinc-cadmium efflux system outer membrane protein